MNLHKSDKTIKHLLLFFFAMILFNYPVIKVLDGQNMLVSLGYLFIVWGMVIVLTYFLVEKNGQKTK